MRPTLLLLAFALVGCASTEPEPDLSGLEPFWELATALERDQPPSEAAWSALLETPGYATLARHGWSEARLRETFHLALSPSRSEDRVHAKGDYRALLVEHLRYAIECRAELEAFRESLADRDLVTDARALAEAWLPAAARAVPTPAVSFVILEPDARGYERIVVDLVFARAFGDELPLLIAHEMHHVLRDGIHRVRRPPGDLPERDLFAALENLQAEGVADQVDKQDVLAPRTTGEGGEGPVQRLLARVNERYRAAHAEATTTLALMDRVLADYAADPAAAPELGRELRGALVLGGHPVGFHMARSILDAFGRERLVAHVGDPFAFVADYHAAAQRLGGERHAFSDAAHAGLRALREALRR